ncbi:preprotein translocase subunit YajC [Streptococcus pseudoporcinus]|uniref:Preprotein translocase, YajC subunit n=2 Tax=Streptococcus pseudoporcinus TaxID=361101 RepID=G5KA72_9STRE|nr:preprotein translocase subunit YajC [Streptococcus pseudoporcinus]EFR43544.1 preprotein translocase, YajC subunit [Streptococcus pseudoporcinus SPIN 20026]EHI65151.1 preprotein translocase, YajC subunit [Streptococcus pseudoporcinus LQ 940-04]VEF93596.1 preprotein translocase subunit YajC [Streptococcus pseudoporcinus]VTS39416.1 preprotein translocase subunit YajC [Streptococcus pseudoporcinus]
MGFSTIIMFVVFIGLIFFMQRQQKKQAQERQNQMNALQKGDEVVTIGGMYAMVDEVDQDAKKITLDVDGIYLPFELSAIKRVVTKSDAGVETTIANEEVVTSEASENDLPVVEETAIQKQEEPAIKE